MYTLTPSPMKPTDGQPHRWLRNVGTGYADALTGGALFVVLTPVFVRELGNQGYAVWLLAHVVTFYLGFLDIGFGHAQVRFHARWAAIERGKALQGLISTTTSGLLAAGTLAAIAGLLLALIGPLGWTDTSRTMQADLRQVLILLSINLWLAFPAGVLGNLYRGAQRFDLANLRAIALRLITAAAQLYCLLHRASLVWLAAIELASTGVRILIDVWTLRALLPELMHAPVRWKPRIWKGMRRFALWSAFEDLLMDGATRLEQVLIALLLPLALLTPWSLASAAGGLLLLAIGPVSETLLPLAAQWHAERHDAQLARLLKAGSKCAVGIAAPAALFLWVFGDQALRWWSPDGMAEAPSSLLPLICLHFLVSAFLTTSAMLLLAAGRVRTVTALTLVEVLLSTLLILLLAPRHGLMGVVTGLLVANVLIGFALQLPIAARAFSLDTPAFLWTVFGRVVLAMVPCLLVAIAIRSHVPEGLAGLIVAAAAIGLCYVLAMYLFGTSAGERREYRMLWEELRR